LELPIPPEERYDLVHTNPEGSRRIGEYMSRKLRAFVKEALPGKT